MAKQKIKLLLLILTILLPFTALSEQINEEAGKNKITIYNFNYIKPDVNKADTAESDSSEDIKKFQYYSFIIPQTLAKNISSEYSYVADRKYDTLEINDEFESDEERINHIRGLINVAENNGADYLISGECSIAEDILTVTVTIFNAKGHDIETFQHESSELGVVFKETTDTIAAKTVKNIEIMTELDKKRFRPSPFLPVYSLLQGFSAGLDSGYLFIQNPWKDFYNDSYFASPYIMYNFTSWFALSLKYDYIQTDSKDKDFTDYYQADFQGIFLSAHLKYNITSNASVGLSAGGGLMETTIVMNPADPFLNPGLETSSKDPYFNGTFYLDYKISSIELSAGLIHKRIYYRDEPIKMSGIYGGIGFLF
jgi:hypothetical protein